MAEKFRQFQRAEVTDTAFPLLKRKAFPIVRWEVSDSDKIMRVQLELVQNTTFEWFDISQVQLFKGHSDHALIGVKKLTRTVVERLFRHKRIINNF